jgi:hypothetical protein
MAAAAGADGGGGEEDENGLLKLPKLPKFVELQPASSSKPAGRRTADNTGRRKRAIGMDSSVLLPVTVRAL